MNFDFHFKELGKVPTIVFDLDGTMTDFRKFDKHIIREEIFKEEGLVLFIDKLAWLVNDLDVMKNTTSMLKFRLFIYCLLSGKKYRNVINRYKQEYVKFSREDILKHKNLMSNLKSKGYHVIILSNNKLADRIFLEEAEIVSARSKMLQLEKIKENCRVLFFVGNNLMDDVLVARALNIRAIYVGKSKMIPKKFTYARFNSLDKLKNISNIKKSGD